MEKEKKCLEHTREGQNSEVQALALQYKVGLLRLTLITFDNLRS